MSKKKFKERKQKKQKEEVKSLRKTVLFFFDESPGQSFDFKQLARQIGRKDKGLNKELFRLLDA